MSLRCPPDFDNNKPRHRQKNNQTKRMMKSIQILLSMMLLILMPLLTSCGPAEKKPKPSAGVTEADAARWLEEQLRQQQLQQQQELRRRSELFPSQAQDPFPPTEMPRQAQQQQQQRRCPTCQGTTNGCRRCRGQGITADSFGVIRACTGCNGGNSPQPCYTCNGVGTVPASY